MGCESTISMSRFPTQGNFVGKRVEVFFHSDNGSRIGGIFVRDDIEHPFVSIIRLDDGRHVLTTECKHSHPK